jgi:hydroxypyruvate reductase 2
VSKVLLVPELPEYGYAEAAKYFECDRLPTSRLVGDLPARAEDYTVVFTRGTSTIDRSLLDQLPNVGLIASVSAGLDGIDLAEAQRRGIMVTHTGDVLANDVADIALGLTLNVFRRLVVADHYVRNGSWASKGSPPLATSLGGRIAGIVGLGKIGHAVARRLKACNMEIIYHNRQPRADVDYLYFEDLEEMAARADLLVLSCPATEETYHLIDAQIISALGAEAVLVNVARGSVVNEVALIDALSSGKLGGAGLDVFQNEPHPAAELLSMQNVVLSPHIGSATLETRRSMVDSAIGSIRDFLDSQGTNR